MFTPLVWEASTPVVAIAGFQAIAEADLCFFCP
jgi:hypothetical protein